GADRREGREDGVDRERAEHGQAAQQQGQATVVGNPVGEHRLIVRAAAAPTTPRKLYCRGSTRWEKRPAGLGRKPLPKAQTPVIAQAPQPPRAHTLERPAPARRTGAEGARSMAGRDPPHPPGASK